MLHISINNNCFPSMATAILKHIFLNFMKFEVSSSILFSLQLKLLNDVQKEISCRSGHVKAAKYVGWVSGVFPLIC